MATKLGRMVTYLVGLLNIKSFISRLSRFDQVLLQGHVINKNHYISFTTIPLATKLVRMETYHKQLLPIKLLDPLVA